MLGSGQKTGPSTRDIVLLHLHITSYLTGKKMDAEGKSPGLIN